MRLQFYESTPSPWVSDYEAKSNNEIRGSPAYRTTLCAKMKNDEHHSDNFKAVAEYKT